MTDNKKILELELQLSTAKQSLLDVKDGLDDIKNRLEYIVTTLSDSIEQGNQLHIGIVLGQSIKELQDIIYK